MVGLRHAVVLARSDGKTTSRALAAFNNPRYPTYLSMAPPVIRGVEVAAGGIPYFGGDVTLAVANILPDKDTMAVAVGGTPCTNLRVLNATAVRCRAGDAGDQVSAVPVTLTTGGQQDSVRVLGYQPSVDRVEPPIMALHGGELSVSARGLGAGTLAVTLRWASTGGAVQAASCSAVRRVTASMLRCTIGNYDNNTHPQTLMDVVVAAADGRFGTGARMLRYDVQCPAGEYYKSDRDGCADCPVGFRCEQIGTVVPIACQAGTHCPEGTATAAPCARGKFSADPKVPCADCAPGKYQSSTGADRCADCEAGTTFQSAPGLCGENGGIIAQHAGRSARLRPPSRAIAPDPCCLDNLVSVVLTRSLHILCSHRPGQM